MAKKEKSDTARLAALFEGSGTAHGTHGVPTRAPDSLKWEIKTTARTLRGPATLELWEQHVAGRKPLGVISIRDDSKCKHGSIDYDVYDADLLEIIALVEKLRLPLVPCRSKSGGLHLFLFLKEWTPAVAVQSVLRDLAAQLGISGSEIFPKQTAVLTDRGDMGNWMVMPYYGDTYGGKIHEQVGLKKSGGEMLLAEFLALAESRMVDSEQLSKIARKRSTSGAGRGPGNGGNVPFGDGPPCLQTLADMKVPKGSGNNALFHMGVYYKKKYATGWQEHLDQAARDYLDPPGSADGTASVIKQLEKRDYQYTCKNQPMCDHCNVALCRTRRYGIGEEGNYPSLAGLAKLASEPPVWFVSLEGHEGRLEMSTMELQNYLLFHRICMARVDKTYKNMKQSDWFDVVNEAMKRSISYEGIDDKDLSSRGMFHELLEDFCTNRQRGDKKEDLLSGRPWLSEENSRYEFRMRDLVKFLQREGVKDWNRGQLASKIRELNGGNGSEFYNIKGRGTRYWWVPRDVLQEMPEVSTPQEKEEGI